MRRGLPYNFWPIFGEGLEKLFKFVPTLATREGPENALVDHFFANGLGKPVPAFWTLRMWHSLCCTVTRK